MKNYVIAIADIEQSVQAANRCIKSANKYNIDVEIFDAVTPRNTDLKEFMLINGIKLDGFQEKYSRLDNCVAAFASHYSLWLRSIQLNEAITIFEHDAVVVQPIPNVSFNKVISWGKPSYGKFNTPNTLGVGPLVSKRYFPGAHAYSVTPAGAKDLVAQAQINARPTDVFLNIDTFPWIQEYYPWPVEARDSFSTIQKTEGCLAKHNYGESYEII